MKKHSALKLAFALALAVVLCVAVMAVSAFATDYPVTTAAEFQDAVLAATSSDPANIILQNDITFDAAYNIVPTTSSVTVTVSAPAGESYTVTMAGLCELRSYVTFQINEGVTFDFNSTSRFYVNRGSTIILNGGTIQNGRASTGGAISGAAGSNVYIYDGLIQNCTSTGSCGGVYITSSSTYSSTFEMSGGTITGCTAATWGGGLGFAGGYVNATITGGTVTGNTATHNAGGMYLYANMTAPVTGLTVSNNTVTEFKPNVLNSDNSIKTNYYSLSGAGITVEGSAKNYTLGSGTVVTGNTAVGGRGGGIGVISAKSLVLDGVEISDNHATDATNGHCGGVFILGGSVTVKGTTLIDGNDAAGRCGGIGSQISGSATLTITGGTISNNTSVAHCGGVEASYGTFTMSGGTVTGNTAGTYAGGVLVSTSKGCTISGGTISNNTAGSYAGGLHVSSSNGCTITGGTISNNTAGTYAGGLGIANAGTNSVSGITVTGNVAGTNGGGIYASSTTTDLTISDVTVTGNSAFGTYGGGIYFYGATGTIEDSTITDNRAGKKGNTSSANGGGFYGTASSTATIKDCSVNHNVSYGGGGGIFSKGTLTVEGTEICGNACGVYYDGDVIKVRGTDYGGSGIYVDVGTNVSLKDVTVTGNGNAASGVFLSASGAVNAVSFDGVCVIKENSSGISSYDAVTGKYNIASSEYEAGLGWALGKSATTTLTVKDTISALSDVHISINFSKTSTDTFVGTVVDSAGDPSTTDISAALAKFVTKGGLYLAQDGSNIDLAGTTPVSYTIVSVNNGASLDYNVLDLGTGITLPGQKELVETFTDAPAAGSAFEGCTYGENSFIGFADVTGYGTSPVLNALYGITSVVPGADVDGKTLYATWAMSKTVPGASIKIAGDGTTSGIRFLTILETDTMAAIGIRNLTETEWDNGDIGYVFGVKMTKDYGTSSAKTQTYQSAGGKLFTDSWFGDELYDASFDNRGTNHVFSFGLNLTSSQYEYEFTPRAFIKIQFSTGAQGTRNTPIPTEGDPAAAIVRTARGVARSYAAWLVTDSNPDLSEDNLGLKPAQIAALETIADGAFDLTNKTYANN